MGIDRPQHRREPNFQVLDALDHLVSTSVFLRYALSLHQHPDAGVYAETDLSLIHI